MNTDPMRCCEQLEGKSMYYRPDERPGLIHESDVMPYTCLRTLRPVGPDGQDARPSLCQPHRTCFAGEKD